MSNPVLISGRIIANRQCAAEQFLLSLKLPSSFPTPIPGQFVMVKAQVCPTPLLSRPFSVYAYQNMEDYAIIELLYRVAGKGTRLLSSLPSESDVRIMGPLGNGFTFIPERKNVVLVAGGLGIAPLTFLARSYLDAMRQQGSGRGKPQRRIIFYIGARTEEALAGIERLESLIEEIKIATDDGSRGFHGTVTKLLSRDIAFYSPEDAALYACGPAPMLKSLADLLAGKDFFCQASMEERMACGLGACLGCALPVRERNGREAYMRVCKDGPVFNIGDVVWTGLPEAI